MLVHADLITMRGLQQLQQPPAAEAMIWATTSRKMAQNPSV
jgi:hypothetical protein